MARGPSSLPFNLNELTLSFIPRQFDAPVISSALTGESV